MKDMIRMGESSVLEFKTEEAHKESIAKEVAAFSNFHGREAPCGRGRRRIHQDGEMIPYETKPVHGACINDLNRGYLNRYM